jgi:hypothetical protein
MRGVRNEAQNLGITEQFELRVGRTLGFPRFDTEPARYDWPFRLRRLVVAIAHAGVVAPKERLKQ